MLEQLAPVVKEPVGVVTVAKADWAHVTDAHEQEDTIVTLMAPGADEAVYGANPASRTRNSGSSTITLPAWELNRPADKPLLSALLTKTKPHTRPFWSTPTLDVAVVAFIELFNKTLLRK